MSDEEAVALLTMQRAIFQRSRDRWEVAGQPVSPADAAVLSRVSHLAQKLESYDVEGAPREPR